VNERIRAFAFADDRKVTRRDGRCPLSSRADGRALSIEKPVSKDDAVNPRRIEHKTLTRDLRLDVAADRLRRTEVQGDDSSVGSNPTRRVMKLALWATTRLVPA
jgi:hypothetical protein